MFNLLKYPKRIVFQVIIDKVAHTSISAQRSRDVAYNMIFMAMPEALTARTGFYLIMLLKTDQREFNIPKVPRQKCPPCLHSPVKARAVD